MFKQLLLLTSFFFLLHCMLAFAHSQLEEQNGIGQMFEQWHAGRQNHGHQQGTCSLTEESVKGSEEEEHQERGENLPAGKHGRRSRSGRGPEGSGAPNSDVSGQQQQNLCNGNTATANINTIVCVEGGWVSGVPGIYLQNVTAYLGIPFAASPVGELRWKEPQSAPEWNGTLEASAFASQCIQLSRDAPSSTSSASAASVSGSEDCLMLNVFTTDKPEMMCQLPVQLYRFLKFMNIDFYVFRPTFMYSTGLESTAQGSAKKPVYVWIHGGGYSGDASSNSKWNGEALANKGLVVVSIAYRVGPLGFLALPALSVESGRRNASSNYGLLDQIAALKWVQRNIGAFGGDPSRVTIGGQSAGAGSCYILMQSPLAAGLFQGVIAESGGLFATQDPEISSLPPSHYSMEQAEQLSLEFLATLNISANASLAELRAISATTLVEGFPSQYNISITSWNGKPPYSHSVLDGYVLPKTHQEILAQGLQNQVHLMAGHNLNEWGAAPSLSFTVAEYEQIVEVKYGNISAEFLAIYPAGNSSETASASALLAIQDNTRVSQNMFAQEWLKHAHQPFFQYFWTHSPPGSETTSGASHCSEIIYFFGNLHTDNQTAWTATDYAIAERMSDYVVNFVSFYDPNGPGLPEWPMTVANHPMVMDIGTSFTEVGIAEPLTIKVDFLRRFYATQPAW